MYMITTSLELNFRVWGGGKGRRGQSYERGCIILKLTFKNLVICDRHSIKNVTVLLSYPGTIVIIIIQPLSRDSYSFYQEEKFVYFLCVAAYPKICIIWYLFPVYHQFETGFKTRSNAHVFFINCFRETQSGKKLLCACSKNIIQDF